ncbi:hypothetical protein DL768_009181 [Monosporascus sp. mg162]|nr:hypothetical protein DL768_009181 [Monosporascus sp. mg162]
MIFASPTSAVTITPSHTTCPNVIVSSSASGIITVSSSSIIPPAVTITKTPRDITQTYSRGPYPTVPTPGPPPGDNPTSIQISVGPPGPPGTPSPTYLGAGCDKLCLINCEGGVEGGVFGGCVGIDGAAFSAGTAASGTSLGGRTATVFGSLVGPSLSITLTYISTTRSDLK